MSKYHLYAVRRALKSVQLSGEPFIIKGIYLAHLPLGKTFDGLLNEYDLTKKLDKSSGGWIVERPYRRTA